MQCGQRQTVVLRCWRRRRVGGTSCHRTYGGAGRHRPRRSPLLNGVPSTSPVLRSSAPAGRNAGQSTSLHFGIGGQADTSGTPARPFGGRKPACATSLLDRSPVLLPPRGQDDGFRRHAGGSGRHFHGVTSGAPPGHGSTASERYHCRQGGHVAARALESVDGSGLPVWSKPPVYRHFR